MKIDTDLEKAFITTRTRKIIESYAIICAAAPNEEKGIFQESLDKAYGGKVTIENDKGELYASIEGRRYHVCKMPDLSEILGQKS